MIRRSAGVKAAIGGASPMGTSSPQIGQQVGGRPCVAAEHFHQAAISIHDKRAEVVHDLERSWILADDRDAETRREALNRRKLRSIKGQKLGSGHRVYVNVTASTRPFQSASRRGVPASATRGGSGTVRTMAQCTVRAAGP